MKKLFTILLMFVSVSIYAQSLTLAYEGEALAPADTIFEVINYTSTTTTNFEESIYLDIINNTNAPVTFKVSKIELEMVEGAEAALCIGGICYPPTTDLSNEITIGAHDTIHTYQSSCFHLSYKPHLGIGTSYILFQFTNVSNPADITEVTFSMTTQNGSSIRNDVAASELRAYPNPASGVANIVYSYKGNASNVNLVVKNLMGATIASQPIAADGNSVKLDVSEFTSGIYFYSIEADGRPVVTKKLLVK